MCWCAQQSPHGPPPRSFSPRGRDVAEAGLLPQKESKTAHLCRTSNSHMTPRRRGAPLPRQRSPATRASLPHAKRDALMAPEANLWLGLRQASKLGANMADAWRGTRDCEHPRSLGNAIVQGSAACFNVANRRTAKKETRGNQSRMHSMSCGGRMTRKQDGAPPGARRTNRTCAK